MLKSCNSELHSWRETVILWAGTGVFSEIWETVLIFFRSIILQRGPCVQLSWLQCFQYLVLETVFECFPMRFLPWRTLNPPDDEDRCIAFFYLSFWSCSALVILEQPFYTLIFSWPFRICQTLLMIENMHYILSHSCSSLFQNQESVSSLSKDFPVEGSKKAV